MLRFPMSVASAVGYATGTGLVLTATRLALAAISSCDAVTARCSLPNDAFAGKVVWITGASSGLGRELAIQLARQGAKLILSSRRRGALEEVKAQLSSPPEDVYVLPLDLEDLEALESKAVEALSAFGGRLDVLINNGGVSTRTFAREASLANDIKLVRVDYLSYVALTKAVLPTLVAHRGQVINVSSLAGKFGIGLRTAYCGAKHAILGFFDALRLEEQLIGVLNVCPGSVRTDVARNSLNADGSKYGSSDVNIENGLPVEFAVAKILAAAHHRIDEAWIAKPGELIGAYVSQYVPSLAKRILKGRMAGMAEATLSKL